MRLNEHTGMSPPHPRFCQEEDRQAAIVTPGVTLVPYEARHVEQYHEWMSDPEIQEATASEPLTLDEEYENQQSWRTSHDKLTFIICQPLSVSSGTKIETVQAGDVDASERMIGDINFFIYLSDDDDDDDNGDMDGAARIANEASYVGEVDVMIASKEHRGKGVGHAAVTTLLTYVHRNRARILAEHVHGEGKAGKGSAPELKGLMAKIKEGNSASIALFRRLGFVQKGEVNYFGEIQMVLRDLEAFVTSSAEEMAGLEYREVAYSR
ncbi:N-acetyltransferase 9-like protein [Colletotrichum tanaceti]|uniref:N-acetyltransferase 9-like protein n=1 Tax=Colletotrichum tanaceti TaxID=1306861 RepID=A0A4U6XGS1_9PEZI|nr:N-acetyltransferase 9-like protein [Colletotrichum tanaceti]TKW54985.1 N-acetyltransferase 9-like protein [Colletotrichum tanaceti]